MRRAFVIATLAALGVVLAAPGASAHALRRSSVPDAGALLDASPPEVRITFTEPPDLTLSTIRVRDSGGDPVTKASAGGVAGVAHDLRLPLPSLPKGVYSVTWRVLSRVDGHVTAGTFSFGVGVAPPAHANVDDPPEGASKRPPALGIAGRFGLAGGLALLLGAAAVGLFVLGRPLEGRLGVPAAWLLAAGGLVALIASERSQIGSSLSKLLSSQRGELLVREAVAVAVVGLVVLLAVLRPGRPALIALGGASAAALLSHALAGHAGAPGSARILKVAVQWVHLLAVGVWAGGLLWVLLASRGEESPERLAALRRYSRLAGIALAVVVVTGSLRALDEIGAFGRLFNTDFGLTFVVKMSVFALLVALGALNRWRILPALARGARRLGAFRRSVGAEVALAATIFGVTGVLAGLPPSAIEAQARRPAAPARVLVEGADFATTVRVRLVVAPGTAGPNSFEASVVDYDTRRPVEATRVALRFTLPSRSDIAPSELELKRAGEVWRAEGTELAVEGRWRIVVLVQTASAGVEVPLDLQTALPKQDIKVLSEGPPKIFQIGLGEARTVQAYVDPGKAGEINQIHFTFFDAKGGELPVASGRMEGTGPDGATVPLTVRKLGPGHFVADLEPKAGTWLFTVEARTSAGEILRAYFDERIP